MSAATNPDDLTEFRGGEAPRYDIGGKQYIVLDLEDYGLEGPFVIDIEAERRYRIFWDRAGTDLRAPTCECEQLSYDVVRRLVTAECPHWQAWLHYYREYIYEPSVL